MFPSPRSERNNFEVRAGTRDTALQDFGFFVDNPSEGGQTSIHPRPGACDTFLDFFAVDSNGAVYVLDDVGQRVRKIQ
jgi:hypothetical protein